MKMHLLNMLNQLGANADEKEELTIHFKTNTVTHRGVADALAQLRKTS
jgi:hydroxymethylglutaryl-CoA reductase